MIVDDDESDRKKLERQVIEHGYRVVTVAEGRDVLNRIAVDKPDLIVLNLVLSDIEGRDIIMSLKNSPETARIPILAMSGAHLDRSVSDLLRNFGIRIISKPWDAIELLDGIAHAFLRKTPFVLGA
jgi:DNA-binding response OmpR family regulator